MLKTFKTYTLAKRKFECSQTIIFAYLYISLCSYTISVYKICVRKKNNFYCCRESDTLSWNPKRIANAEHAENSSVGRLGSLS